MGKHFTVFKNLIKKMLYLNLHIINRVTKIHHKTKFIIDKFESSLVDVYD
jgi:hypothetical protein